MAPTAHDAPPYRAELAAYPRIGRSNIEDVPWIVPNATWQELAITGAVASLLLLILFWHAWLVLGIVISAAVLYAVFVARWPAAVFGVG